MRRRPETNYHTSPYTYLFFYRSLNPLQGRKHNHLIFATLDFFKPFFSNLHFDGFSSQNIASSLSFKKVTINIRFVGTSFHHLRSFNYLFSNIRVMFMPLGHGASTLLRWRHFLLSLPHTGCPEIS